jgi:anti-sigma-K factor RskA
MISCRDCREDLSEYALGQVDGAQAAEVSEHLAACPVCRQELAELEAAWAALPLLLPPVRPSPELIEDVLERIDGAKAVRAPATRPAYAPGRRERVLSYVVAASVLVGLSAAYYTLTRPAGEDAAAQRAAEMLAERLGKLQQFEQLLKSENVRLVSLHRPESPAQDQAFVVWDMAAGQWHFYGSDLPPAPDGRVYQLWAAQGDGALLAGPTFEVDVQGLGRTVGDFPGLDPRVAAKAIVTLEPAGGSKKPTGKVFLEAAL